MPTSANSTASKEWLHSLMATTREFAFMMISLDGVIQGWEGASALLFGYTVEEAVGMAFSKLFNEGDVALGLDRTECALAVSGGRSEDDRWHVRKNGSLFWGSGVLEAIRDADGRIVALAKTVRDRTDVRAQVIALQNRVAECERTNRKTRESMATFAHEFRNQLSPMANAFALAERTPGAPLAARSLRTLQDKLGVIRQLLDDVVNASHEQPAALHLQFEDVVVQDALRRAADAAAGDVAKRRQELAVTLPPTPIVLRADSRRLGQMLGNLLGNASKFTPEKGAIQFSATVEDDMVAIRVDDNGIGIAPDMLPRIFDLFTREASAGAPEGMGIGLAVVKQLATLHGGFIEGRSPGRGNGSVFTLRLPLRQASPDSRPAAG